MDKHNKSKPLQRRKHEKARSEVNSPSLRVGALQWTKTASGGKFRHLLRERTASRQEMTGRWDALLGYVGPPLKKSVSPEPPTEVAPKNQDYRELRHPLCLRSLPRRGSQASVTQALLYMKLRDSKYSKVEALKHSSAQRFKTDSGVKSGLYTFHGHSLRVPVTDPEKRFSPYHEVPDTGDYERLSQAYNQFLLRYQVTSGELERIKNSNFHIRLTDFQEKPKPTWMLPREKLPKTVPNLRCAELKPVLPVDSELSSHGEVEDYFPSPAFSPSPVGSSSPVCSPSPLCSPSPACSPPVSAVMSDAISRVESFSGGNIMFREVSPNHLKQPEAPDTKSRWKPRKSTVAPLSRSFHFERSRRRATTLALPGFSSSPTLQQRNH